MCWLQNRWNLLFVLTQLRPLWEAPLQKITRKQQPSGKIDDRLVPWLAGLTHSRSHSVCTCQVSLNDTFRVNFPPEGQDYTLKWSVFKYKCSSSIYPRDLYKAQKCQKTCHFLIMTLYENLTYLNQIKPAAVYALIFGCHH